MGIDLLSSFDNVDTNRIAYVGHSLGVAWGGVLAGVEKRIQAYVLMAGDSRFSKWLQESDHPLATKARNSLPEEIFAGLVSTLDPLEAVHYIKHAAPASVYRPAFARQ